MNRRATHRLVLVVLIALVAAACSRQGEPQAAPAATASPTAAVPPTATAESANSASDDEAAPATPAAPAQDDDCALNPERSRVDLRIDGNRIAQGRVNFATGQGPGSATSISLPGTAVWVLADPSVALGWYVVLDDGSAVRVDGDNQVTDADPPLSEPPMLNRNGEPASAFERHVVFSNPVDDSRVVQHGSVVAVLSSPTDRYGHGVLGDRIEAAAIEWLDLCTGLGRTITIDAPDVIEGISPMLADIDADGEPEIIVTLSNASTGARLAVFELDGQLLAESDPIGRGNRWRNQLAVAPFGPDGEIELVDVRTPHIGGTLQAFQLVEVDGAGVLSLQRVAASAPDFTTHVLGSRNLDMGLAMMADNNEQLDVLVPTADRRSLVAFERTREDGGWRTVGQHGFGGRLTSNLSSRHDGRATLVAAGVGDRLLIWGG